MLTFGKKRLAKAGIRVGLWVEKQLTSRGMVAWGVQIAFGFTLGMVWAASDAHAGLAAYGQTLVKGIDFSGTTFPLIGAALGGGGVLASGKALWAGIHDGQSLGDNVKPIMALVPSSALCGYSTYLAAVTATGNGS